MTFIWALLVIEIELPIHNSEIPVILEIEIALYWPILLILDRDGDRKNEDREYFDTSFPAPTIPHHGTGKHVFSNSSMHKEQRNTPQTTLSR